MYLGECQINSNDVSAITKLNLPNLKYLDIGAYFKNLGKNKLGDDGVDQIWSMKLVNLQHLILCFIFFMQLKID